jgi:uncharacterized protein YceH (UPF0502 family)
VEAFLRELAERPAGALVVELSRQPGSRENRWAHLLSGAPAIREAVAAAAPDDTGVAASELSALKANVARLEAELAELKTVVAKLCSDLGVRG